jgi:hypothetical protein
LRRTHLPGADLRRIVVLTSLALACCAAPAHAGTYDVYSCTLPDGRGAPTEGWEPLWTYKDGFASTNSCLSPPSAAPTGALRGDITRPSDREDFVSWIFTPPKYTTIGNFTLYRTAHIAGNGSWYHDFGLTYGLRGPFDEDHYAEFCSGFASCGGHGVGRQRPFDPANRLSRANLQAPQLVAQLACDTAGSYGCAPKPGADHGWFEIYSARIGLSDLYAPNFVRAPNGSLLATDAPLQGERSITMSTTDRGGGIEKVGVVVDGVVRTQRLSSSRCRRPFMALVPCPTSHTATLTLDTAQIPNGTHTLQASAVDVAGNETRSDPVAVTTLNGSLPNGRGASRFTHLSAWIRSPRDSARRSLVVRYGSVRFAEGRLTDSGGTPIAGAVLQVAARVQRPGATYKPAGTVTTGEDGRFAYRIARGPSRSVRLEYKAYSLDPAPVSTASVSLGVRAGLKLRLRPRRVHNGQRVKFSGRLRGGPGRKGTRVTIDVLVPDARRRVPIGNVKADRSGRFRFAYRFRRTLVKARYRFQARLTPQPGYPYRGATSRRVSVLVAP